MLDGRGPVEALLVEEGRVVAIGSSHEIGARAGQSAERVYLNGATVIPGLIDTHPHVISYGWRAECLVDITGARSHSDIVAAIRERARITPPGEWIVTSPVGEPHYFIRRSWRHLAEGRLPDRHVLDKGSAEHPVWIQAWAPYMPNVCAFNSLGLSRLGISRSTAERQGNVFIESNDSGDPTGLLWGAVNTYYNTSPFFDDTLRPRLPFSWSERRYPQGLPGVARSMRAHNALGVTTVWENHNLTAAEIEMCRTFHRHGILSLRMLISPESHDRTVHEPGADQNEGAVLRARVEAAARMASTTDEMLRFNGLTIMPGGIGFAGTLLMREPYKGPFGEPTTGVRAVPVEAVRNVIELCAERGVRLNLVSMGNREHDEYLDILEDVAMRHDFRSRNWVLVHAFFLEAEQARRFARLGFHMTTCVGFTWGKGDMYAERMGDRVLADLIPLRRELDSGLMVAGSTDWGPKNVFEQMYLAVVHEFAGSGRRNDGPPQVLTREEALAMWTVNAARVMKWEGVGTLTPGAHADLVVIDRDPLTCELEELPATRVLRTVVGGRTVYDAGELYAQGCKVVQDPRAFSHELPGLWRFNSPWPDRDRRPRSAGR